MRYLTDSEAKPAEKFFTEASRIATQATCLRAHCGTIIVASNGDIIGQGFNGPPLGQESNRTCELEFDLAHKPKYDLTCCIHAEWRAILDAAKHHPDQLPGSRLYFMRIDQANNLTRAGDPFCTVCSRLALESGIAEFALWQDQGMAVWSTTDYDRDSYNFYHVEQS